MDEQELNEEILAEVLSPFVRIGNESGDFIPTDEFEALNSTKQTAVVLLYQKAAFELDLAEQKGGTPQDISNISGINHNTVKTAVRNLEEDNIASNEDGLYSIPSYNYREVEALIEGE